MIQGSRDPHYKPSYQISEISDIENQNNFLLQTLPKSRCVHASAFTRRYIFAHEFVLPSIVWETVRDFENNLVVRIASTSDITSNEASRIGASKLVCSMGNSEFKMFGNLHGWDALNIAWQNIIMLFHIVRKWKKTLEVYIHVSLFVGRKTNPW